MPGNATPGKAEAADFVATMNQVIIFPLVTLIVAVCFLVFVYGCFEYVLNSENQAARDTGRKHIMWGILGFLVILGAYTILAIFANTFGIFETLECAEDADCGVYIYSGDNGGASPF